MTAASETKLPLFYEAPEPLSPQRHGDWRLLEGDTAFAANTAFVPIVAVEIPAASRHYPIVFVTGSPVAVVGLETINLFVENGRWDETAYIPAYVRRYPFGFIPTQDHKTFQLAIDTASNRIVKGGKNGVPLFDGDKPSGLTQKVMEFCAAFGRDSDATIEFMKALEAKELLMEQRADATLPDGRKFGVGGFRIVDAKKFGALDDKTVLEWHRSGYLGLINFHLLSLDRFSALGLRQAKRSTPKKDTGKLVLRKPDTEKPAKAAVAPKTTSRTPRKTTAPA